MPDQVHSDADGNPVVWTVESDSRPQSIMASSKMTLLLLWPKFALVSSSSISLPMDLSDVPVHAFPDSEYRLLIDKEFTLSVQHALKSCRGG